MPDALDVAAQLDFVLTLRRRWADTLYPALRAQYDAGAQGRRAADPEAIAADVHALPLYPWFAWLERGSQKMLWRAVEDAVALQGTPAVAPISPATLTLDPSLELPRWYTQFDIHLQPGGVWSQDSAAAVYELGAKLVMLGENDDYKIHRLFTQTAIPRRSYRRIVDLGCGFGKSTWPLKKEFAQAEVIGVDLAAPCLRLAAQRSGRQGLAIHFRQADASATRLESGSADLVTSTMLLHELPVKVAEQVFAESARLLAPGGVLRFLDFQRTGDAFRDLAMLEHGARNNEPYLPPMITLDVAAMARQAGLTHVRWVAFDERARGRLDAAQWPERREWHFPWAVLEAEKPE
ncbi:MAG TPA: class I SAM-dependent methyltransferase [Steroidobacteraceae bacterium]|nr:class I SAM-dependent methyltransferase [Steroidobacteraceae bacterium]